MELAKWHGHRKLQAVYSIRFHATFVTCLVKYVKNSATLCIYEQQVYAAHTHALLHNSRCTLFCVMSLVRMYNWNGHCWLVGRQSKANVSCFAAFLTSTYRLCCIAFTCSKLRITCFLCFFFGIVPSVYGS